MDLTQHDSLSPGLRWPLVKESYSSSHCCLHPESESCSPVGAQGEGDQTGDNYLRSYRSNKTRDRRTDRKGYSGNHMREHLCVLIDNNYY